MALSTTARFTTFSVLSHPTRPVHSPIGGEHADRVPPLRRDPHPNLQQVIRWKEEGRVGKMKEMLRKEVELSVSPYDTAWVAMVGRNNNTQQQFPQCLRWVAENQLADGSWASYPADPLLVKDSLCSTLAAVLALRRWGVGDQLVNRGLDFLRCNAWAATDKNQRTPIGFDTIFTGMMESAAALGLNLPFTPSTFQPMLQNRDLLVQSGEWASGKMADVAYSAEGLAALTRVNGGGGQWKWEEVLRKHQRKNGSLFNSPSATAAALLHLHDDKSLSYLDSVLSAYKNSPAVPAVFPLDLLSRLDMVDNLVKLGIHQYFTPEIALILDDVDKCWIRRDEELFSDMGCLAKAFRLLRVNGYHVSSDVFEGVERQEDYMDSVLTQYKTTETILELYKASLTTIHKSEPILDRMKDWTTSYLRQASLSSSSSSNGSDQEQRLAQEVGYALKFPYASLERIENRLSIETAGLENDVKLLKTSYSCSTTDNNKEWVEFAVEDFNKCQSLQRKELEVLERWVKEYRIEELKFARQKVAYGFFAAAAILFSPEHAEARNSWAKNTVLVTLIDDLFDVGGSEEELLNFIDLVKAWDGYESVGFCSEQVEIIFKAVYDATNEYVAKASLVQGRCVKHHFMNMWLVLLDCMWQEYVRGRDKIIPTMEEYIATGYVSVALGPVILVPMYFLGCHLSEEAMLSKEYDDLFMHVSVIARLLNDLATIGREIAQGKENSLALGMMQGKGNGKVTEEEARREIQAMIEKHRKELLRMVVLKEGDEGSTVPRAVKEVFWQTSKIVHMFYMSKDGFSSPHEMVAAIDSVIYKPIVLPHQHHYST